MFYKFNDIITVEFVFSPMSLSGKHARATFDNSPNNANFCINHSMSGDNSH